MSEQKILPRFIVLEGIDGSGRSTQSRLLGEALSKAEVPHWISAEPTGLPTGLLVRRVLGGEVRTCPETLARLFAADRGEHIFGRGGIMEHLGRGELVICDRYVFSSLAYQGIACGPELPRMLNAAFPLPELLLYFDIDPGQSMARVEGRGEAREIFEELSFQAKVREAYREILSRYSASPMRILKLDAERGAMQLSRDVLRAAGEVMGRPLSIDENMPGR